MAEEKEIEKVFNKNTYDLYLSPSGMITIFKYTIFLKNLKFSNGYNPEYYSYEESKEYIIIYKQLNNK